MAPGAIISSDSVSHDGEQDVDLTAMNLEHKMTVAKGDPLANGHTNGHLSKPKLQELDISQLTYTITKNPRPIPDEETACSGTETICTDHMAVATWHYQSGWSAPEIKPYGPFTLMPTASVLHYATECFDGLKAYRGHDGKLRLFRPALNAARLRMSAIRITLPGFNPDALEQLLLALMGLDGPKWLPKSRPGSYLYLRPSLIGTHAQLGVQVPKEALLFITASFLPRLDATPGGQRLHTSPEDMVRAWVGGFGYAKLGANYAPSFPAMQEAQARGFNQVLWLYGQEGYCTEAGTSNFFVVWRAKGSGRLELVTAPLDDRLILDGVNRRSLLELARERLGAEMDITERKFTIDEVLEAESEGRLVESFVSGTAYFVCPVSLIHHRGKDIAISMGKGDGGYYTLKLKGWLSDIMWGNEQHEWGVVVQEQEQD